MRSVSCSFHKGRNRGSEGKLFTQDPAAGLESSCDLNSGLCNTSTWPLGRAVLTYPFSVQLEVPLPEWTSFSVSTVPHGTPIHRPMTRLLESPEEEALML